MLTGSLFPPVIDGEMTSNHTLKHLINELIYNIQLSLVALGHGRRYFIYTQNQ